MAEGCGVCAYEAVSNSGHAGLWLFLLLLSSLVVLRPALPLLGLWFLVGSWQLWRSPFDCATVILAAAAVVVMVVVVAVVVPLLLPLGCPSSPRKFPHPVRIRYREAELKHGRLAMVALAGWPVATLLLGLLTKVGVHSCTGCACPVSNKVLGLRSMERIERRASPYRNFPSYPVWRRLIVRPFPQAGLSRSAFMVITVVAGVFTRESFRFRTG